MWLLIDDERNLGCDLIARTPEGARAALALKNLVGLCIDHDLGFGETGYDLLVWALEKGYVPAIVEVVTSNPPARERMGAALVAAGWVRKGPYKFIHKDHDYAE